MPIARNASSSDLALARAITHRLASPRPDPTPGRAGGNYLRFRSGGVRPGLDPAVAPSQVTAAPIDLQISADELAGSGGWLRLLDWICAVARADAAFLTDARGLVIASGGAIDDDAAQGIGARIVISFAHADQMDGRGSRSLAIELDERWLTGLRIPFGDESVIVGLLAAEPMGADLRAGITAAVAAKLSGL
jgi:hypothetical protein